MKPPTCKVCQKAHWTYEGHSASDIEVPQHVSEMAKGALGGGLLGQAVEDVAKTVESVTGIKRTE